MFESLSNRLGASLNRLAGKGVLREEDIDAALREVRLSLLEADVNFRVVRDFVDRIGGRLKGAEIRESLTPAQQVVKVVHEELVQLLGGNEQGLVYADSPPAALLMLVGLQGSGKTTTAVKLALLARRDGHQPGLVALDLKRPAAVEQLQTLAERERIPFFTGTGPVEEVAVGAFQQARSAGCDVAILDTAGRLQTDRELMDELVRVQRAVPVSETLLVADAMTGQEAVNVGREFHEALTVSGVILTKLDGDTRGGAALSLRAATGQQIRFAGVGERPSDLEVFHADRMASRILGMGDVLTLIEKAERTLDREKAAQVEKNLRSGQLSFDDFLTQLQQIRQMGIGSLLDMMPGGLFPAAQLKDGDPDAALRKMEAIILSMTPRERAHPELLNGSRRKRIAAGSGTQVADVNQVVKARDAVQGLTKQFGLMGGKRGGSVLGRKLARGMGLGPLLGGK